MRRPTGPSRRTVLAGGVAAIAASALGGCQGPRWYPAEISPDEYVLRGVIEDKLRLVARYKATIDAGSGPVELLKTQLDHHEQHVKALRERLPEDSRVTDPKATATSGPRPEPVPDTPLTAAALQVAEETSAGARGREAAKVSDLSLSQLLASVGACEVGHARMLAEA